jgi:hypothetical protein
MLDSNGPDGPRKPLDVDFAEAEKFLKALDPTATKFTFQTFDDDGDRGNKDLVRVLHGTLAEHFDELKRLNDRGAGVFVTVNETDFRGRSAENIVRVRALWVDLDGAPLEPVLADARKVHIVVDTSPARWHAYWLVTGVTLDQFSAKMRVLITLYNTDTSVHDLPRVMRLPGFVHRKGTPHLVRVVSVNDAPPYIGSAFASQESEPRQPADGDGTADVNLVAAAVAVIPNPDLAWGEWCSMIMAIYRATGGSDAGLEIAKAYSSKSAKNDDAGTEKKWRELDSSPPDQDRRWNAVLRGQQGEPEMAGAGRHPGQAGDQSRGAGSAPAPPIRAAPEAGCERSRPPARYCPRRGDLEVEAAGL